MLGGLALELEEILHYCEMRWFDVSEGNLTEEEIHKLQFEIKKRKMQAVKKHLGVNSLPTKDDYLSEAESLTRTYFETFYPIGWQDDRQEKASSTKGTNTIN